MHLGKGSYGSVVVSRYCNNHAVKNFVQTDFKFFVRELWFLSLFKDVPNICQLVSYDIEKIEITMIRYQTNLHKLMKSLPYGTRFTLTDDIINQTSTALSYLHSRGIAHNDISESNIFCNYNYSTNKIECFLGDFSLTSVDDDYKSHDKPQYLYFDRDMEATNAESDVWSLGITIFYFLSKKIEWSQLPYDVTSTYDCIDYTSLFPDYQITKYTYEVLCQFLQFNAKARPRVEVTYEIIKRFNTIKRRTAKNTTRRDALKYMKYVTVDRCLIKDPDNKAFVNYFTPIDIIDYVKRNF
jgi:serine/threonine protein kinase